MGFDSDCKFVKTGYGFVDLSTGFEWLALDKTVGLSPIEAKSSYPQFRYASLEELDKLFKASVPADANVISGSVLVYSRCSRLIDLLGQTFSIAGTGKGLIGFAFADPADVGTLMPKEISTNPSMMTGVYSYPVQNFSALSGDTKRNDTATFLVRID